MDEKYNKKDVSKQKKVKSKGIPKDYDIEIDDFEMLRFQGLMRCKHCKNPYPLTMIICPTCGKTDLED